MKNLSKILMGGAISLLALMPAAAGAHDFLVTFDVPGLNIAVTWQQDAAPAPNNSLFQQFTLVPIYNFQSTGSNVLSGWTNMTYFNVTAGGGLVTPGGPL